MNGKHIAALAFAATLAASTLPALAVAPVNVTVKWNTQSVGSLVVTTQASASQTHLATAESIFSNLNGGTGICAASDTEAASGTVDFGAVTPDTTNFTDCLEDNAANAFITTNDANGYKVVVNASAGLPANYATAAGPGVCMLPNPAGAYVNNQAYAASARTSNALTPSMTAGNACPAVAGSGVITAAGFTAITTAASTAGTNLPADYELALNNNAPSGQVTMTVTYTLTLL